MLDMDIPSATGTSTSNNVSGSKYGSLQQTPHAAAKNLQACCTSTPEDKAYEFESVELRHLQSMASITQSRRSVSCFELGSDARRYRTIRIGQGSDELRQLSQANVAQLLRTATSSAEVDSTNALLARKALRFRKIWTPEVQGATTASASVSC